MTLKDIRQARLKAWFATRTLPEREKSYLSQLINGKSSFGERAARRIERDYHMPAGYLDSDPDNPESDTAQLILTDEEKRIIECFRGFPDSEKKEQLLIFETKLKKYNQLFAELQATRR